MIISKNIKFSLCLENNSSSSVTAPNMLKADNISLEDNLPHYC